MVRCTGRKVKLSSTQSSKALKLYSLFRQDEKLFSRLKLSTRQAFLFSRGSFFDHVTQTSRFDVTAAATMVHPTDDNGIELPFNGDFILQASDCSCAEDPPLVFCDSHSGCSNCQKVWKCIQQRELREDESDSIDMLTELGNAEELALVKDELVKATATIASQQTVIEASEEREIIYRMKLSTFSRKQRRWVATKKSDEELREKAAEIINKSCNDATNENHTSNVELEGQSSNNAYTYLICAQKVVTADIEDNTKENDKPKNTIMKHLLEKQIEHFEKSSQDQQNNNNNKKFDSDVVNYAMQRMLDVGAENYEKYHIPGLPALSTLQKMKCTMETPSGHQNDVWILIRESFQKDIEAKTLNGTLDGSEENNILSFDGCVLIKGAIGYNPMTKQQTGTVYVMLALPRVHDS